VIFRTYHPLRVELTFPTEVGPALRGERIECRQNVVGKSQYAEPGPDQTHLVLLYSRHP
jgi:hypothetical protein